MRKSSSYRRDNDTASITSDSVYSVASSFRHASNGPFAPQAPTRALPTLAKDASHRPKTTGSLGILIVGIGGRHGSCLLAAILAHRLEIQWCGPKGEPRQPNYYGCLTQLDYYQQKVKGLANVTMAAVGGWVSEQCGWQWC